MQRLALKVLLLMHDSLQAGCALSDNILSTHTLELLKAVVNVYLAIHKKSLEALSYAYTSNPIDSIVTVSSCK